MPTIDQKPNRPTRFLVVLQYYEGDRLQMEDLARLISDLERIRNRNTDVLVFGRDDAQEFDRGVMQKLAEKFNKVTALRCRRRNVRGYPFAANEMFYDLVTLLAQYSPWRDDYFAFINMEADCCPLHPGWLSELQDQFKQAKARGYAAIGHLHGNPINHMNGVAVYDINVWQIVGSGKLNGGSGRVAFDIDKAKDLLPHCSDTPYIALNFQRPTITPEDLFRQHKGDVEPAIHHGVKDSSARDAVRAKHISFTPPQETANKTVFTYFESPGVIGEQENKAVLSIWQEGWRSRGWNPVVLSTREFSQNPRAKQVAETIARLPKVSRLDRFRRWFALETVGGGFLTDYDVLPARFTPADLEKQAVAASFSSGSDTALSAARFTREKIAEFVGLLLAYEAEPDDKVVTDRTVFEKKYQDPIEEDRLGLVVPYASDGWKDAPMIHFSAAALRASPLRGERKSTAMEKYLRGE